MLKVRNIVRGKCIDCGATAIEFLVNSGKDDGDYTITNTLSEDGQGFDWHISSCPAGYDWMEQESLEYFLQHYKFDFPQHISTYCGNCREHNIKVQFADGTIIIGTQFSNAIWEYLTNE